MWQEQICFSSSCFFRLKGRGFLQDYEKFLWKFFLSLALCESLKRTRKQLQHQTYILWAVNTLFSPLGISCKYLNTQSHDTNLLESAGSYLELGQVQITETEKEIRWHSAGEALSNPTRGQNSNVSLLLCFASSVSGNLNKKQENLTRLSLTCGKRHGLGMQLKNSCMKVSAWRI